MPSSYTLEGNRVILVHGVETIFKPATYSLSIFIIWLPLYVIDSKETYPLYQGKMLSLALNTYCRMNISRYEATEKIGHSLFKSDARQDFKHTIVEITSRVSQQWGTGIGTWNWRTTIARFACSTINSYEIWSIFIYLFIEVYQITFFIRITALRLISKNAHCGNGENRYALHWNQDESISVNCRLRFVWPPGLGLAARWAPIRISCDEQRIQYALFSLFFC